MGAERGFWSGFLLICFGNLAQSVTSPPPLRALVYRTDVISRGPMRQRTYALLLTMIVLFTGHSAQACVMRAKLDLRDVQYADTVVVGRIENYRIVLDEAVRKDRRKWLAESKDTPPKVREILTNQKGFLTDYARFDVIVDEVLFGKPQESFSATWDNSTFGEPEKLGPGPFLIALRDPKSRMAPLRAPSATIFPNREPDLLTLLQAPCANAFLFEVGSEEATEIRRIIKEGVK